MIRTGVIGVGHLGSSHARVYARSKECELAGVYDIDREKAGGVAETYGIKAFATQDELLDECDAVSVATPTTVHHSIAMEALGRGLHVLVEKPIASTIEEAEALVELAETKKLKLQVGHIERFNPAFRAAVDYIRQPLFIETHRLSRFGGRGIEVDVILDLMIHDIDLILALAGQEPSEIRCAGAPVLTSTSDIANVRLEFPSGCTANITASRISTNPMRKMRIFQKAGYISIDFAERKSEVYLLSGNGDAAPGVKPVFTVPSGLEGKSIHVFYPRIDNVDMLEAEIGNFLYSIDHDAKPLVDGYAGLRALKVASEIIRLLPEIPR